MAWAALVALLGVSMHDAPAQEGAAAGFSSMQWANASSTEGIKFTLLGDVVADPWRPGGQVGAGRRETLQWDVEFAPASGRAVLKESLKLRPGQSGAAVLVGDFAEKVAASSSSARLPPGYSKTGSGKLLRAALLRFPVGKARDSRYPVYLLNADPEILVKVSVAGAHYDLLYAVPRSFQAPAGQRVKIKVAAPGIDKEMSFTLEPSQRGGIIAFYRPVESQRTSLVFVNLRSLESIKEMVTSLKDASRPGY